MNTPIKDLFALAEEAIAPVIWTEKKALQKFKEAATPEQLREVAKAFRSLEQRAEAAEAKLAELEKQKPNHIIALRFMNDGKHLKPFCIEDMDEAKSWMQENTQGGYVAMSYLSPAPSINLAELVPVEWTNEQCLEFLSIAFRHAEISGDIEMDDIRMAVKMVNAAAPEVE